MPRTRPAWLDDPERVAQAAAKRAATIAAKKAAPNGDLSSRLRAELDERITALDAQIAALDDERQRLARAHEALG